MVDKYVQRLLKDAYKGGGDDIGRYNDQRLHVSDLYKFCPRNYAYCKRKGVSFRRRLFVGQTLGYIFDMGHKIQDIFVDRFARTGMLYGTWHCRACRKRETRFQRIENVCTFCDADALVYEDTVVTIQYGNITLIGSVDTMLRGDMVKPIVFPNECKSIKQDGQDGFKTLEAPLRDHRYQVSLYIDILRTPGVKLRHKDPDEKVSIAKNVATISYAVKGNAKEPFKVFKVEPDEDFIKATHKKLDQVNKFLDNGRLPRRICDSQANMMARDCPSRTVCLKE